MPQRQFSEEQQLSLRDYLRVLVKRKKIIVAIFLPFVVGVAIWSFLSPKIYEISMVIEVGKFGVSDKGEVLYLNSAENIIAKIKENAYTDAVAKALNLSPGEASPDFKVTQPGSPYLIKIAIEERKEKIDAGLQILKQLFLELCERNKDLIESKRKSIFSQIKITSEAMKQNEAKFTGLSDKLIQLRNERSVLTEEVNKTKAKIDELALQKYNFTDKKIKEADSKSLLYTNILQQTTIYMNQLNDQLAVLDGKEEKINSEINSVQARMIELQFQREKLEGAVDNIDNIELVRAPTVSKCPVRPQNKKNIILAIVASLSFAFFFVFFMEFWGSPSLPNKEHF